PPLPAALPTSAAQVGAAVAAVEAEGPGQARRAAREVAVAGAGAPGPRQRETLDHLARAQQDSGPDPLGRAHDVGAVVHAVDPVDVEEIGRASCRERGEVWEVA